MSGSASFSLGVGTPCLFSAALKGNQRTWVPGRVVVFAGYALVLWFLKRNPKGKLVF